MTVLVREAVIYRVPPTSNHLYRNGYHGTRVMTKEGEAFANRVRADLSQEWIRTAPLDPDMPYQVRFVHYMPDLFNKNQGRPGKTGAPVRRFKRKDVSNMRKLLEDVVGEMIGVDDSSTLDAVSSKRLGRTHHVRIEVWQLPLSSCSDEYSDL